MDEVHVTASQPEYLCTLQLNSRLDIDPDTLFGIITDPDNARIFRSMEDCTFRRVLHDEGTRQKVEVEHAAGWRFLMFHGRFVTRLFVEQDQSSRVMAFKLKPGSGGLMRNFEGFWKIEPCPGSDGKASIATLRQKVMPAITAPGLDWIVVGVCKRQISHLIEDLRKEVTRVREGAPIPKEQLKKMRGSWRDAGPSGHAVELSDSEDDEQQEQTGTAAAAVPGPGVPARELSASPSWSLLSAAQAQLEQPQLGSADDTSAVQSG